MAFIRAHELSFPRSDTLPPDPGPPAPCSIRRGFVFAPNPARSARVLGRILFRSRTLSRESPAQSVGSFCAGVRAPRPPTDQLPPAGHRPLPPALALFRGLRG